MKNQELTNFDAQALSTLANAFAKWPDEKQCKKACLSIAKEILNRDIKAFNEQQLSNLANAFSKVSKNEPDDGENTFTAALDKIALAFRERREEFTLLNISQLLNALRYRSDLYQKHAPLLIQSLEDIIKSPSFREANLETLGNLCAGFLMALKTQALKKSTLSRFKEIFAEVKRKSALHLNAQSAQGAFSERKQTRFEALTHFQLSESYAQFLSLVGDTIGEPLRFEIKQWLKDMLLEYGQKMADASTKSWKRLDE